MRLFFDVLCNTLKKLKKILKSYIEPTLITLFYASLSVSLELMTVCHMKEYIPCWAPDRSDDNGSGTSVVPKCSHYVLGIPLIVAAIV
jgi:hypothetical protein